MKRLIVCGALAGAVLACATGLSAAQTAPAQAAPAQAGIDQAIEQMRKDARTEINKLIGVSMAFTSEEAAKFWPLYNAYETRRKALADERLAIIRDYAKNFTSMPDAKATELMQRALGLEEKSQAAKREFLGELQKALPAKTVARFYQVHTRIDTLTSLMLAQEVPLVQ